MIAALSDGSWVWAVDGQKLASLGNQRCLQPLYLRHTATGQRDVIEHFPGAGYRALVAENDTAHAGDLALPKEEGGIAVRAEGKHLGTRWSIVASRAPIVGTLLTAVAFGGELVWLQPQTNPAHFVLTLVTGVVVGAFLGAWNCLARLQDARGTIEYQRQEIARMSKSRTKVEEAFLKKRLSSEGHEPKSGRKKGG